MSIEQSNNKIAKRESSFLQKVGNQISITNKLLQDNFDYLKWWNNLDQIWRDIFDTKMSISFSEISISNIQGNSKLSIQQKRLLNYNKDFENNTESMKIDAIKYLIKSKIINIGRNYPFTLEDLNPLTLFLDLEKIQFINVELKNIQALVSFKKIALINFVCTEVSDEEIKNIQSKSKDCVINFKDKPDSNLFTSVNAC